MSRLLNDRTIKKIWEKAIKGVIHQDELLAVFTHLAELERKLDEQFGKGWREGLGVPQ